MRYQRLLNHRFHLFIVMLLYGFLLTSHNVVAVSQTVTPDAGIEVIDSGVTPPIDPENPPTDVDPNRPSKQPKGSLRLDFVSNLDFGRVRIGKHKEVNAKAQFFKQGTEPRGSYVQLTDVRSESTGWTLMMEQKNQFKTADGQELSGAVLSFDHAWANASHKTEEIMPQVTRETLSLVPGESVIVAQAEKNKGWGVWTVEFGASQHNKDGQKSTLYPLIDSNNQPLINPEWNQPDFGNRAISLSIPDKTTILPKEYNTEIIWTIAKLP